MILQMSPSQLTFYTPQSPDGIGRHLAAGIIKNMGIDDKDQLFKILSDWFDEIKCSATQGMLILSPKLCFDKAIPSASPEDMTKAQQFAALVPFERVATRIYAVSGQWVSISFDHDLIDMFRLLFQKQHISLTGIIPEVVAASLGGEHTITPTAVKKLFKSWSSLDEQSIVPMKEGANSIQEKEQVFSHKHAGVVVIIFVSFLVGLGSLTWFMLMRQ